jgi:hypothetical protein
VDVIIFFRRVEAQGGASVWVQGIYVVPIPAHLHRKAIYSPQSDVFVVKKGVVAGAALLRR